MSSGDRSFVEELPMLTTEDCIVPRGFFKAAFGPDNSPSVVLIRDVLSDE